MNLFCFLLFVLLRSVAGDDTRLAFHSFPSEDDNILALGDAAHNGANRSYIMNERATQSRGSCGALFYEEKVRIQDVAMGRVASFSTSFSFTFKSLGLPRDNVRINSSSNSPRDIDHSGIAFSFTRSMTRAQLQAHMSEIGSAGACRSALHLSDPNHRYTMSGFLIVFAKGKYESTTSEGARISDIRVSKNHDYEYDIAAYTHNLCVNDTYCSYFSDRNIFTAWIDFTSSARILEVRLANGSNPSVGWHQQRSLGSVVAAAVVILWCAFRLASPSRRCRYTPMGLGASPHAFSYAELRMATDNFDERNLLGTSGSGSVYIGFFEASSGTRFVAVKQIHFLEPKQAKPKQVEFFFHAEVACLGQVRHRNVVQLQGLCQRPPALGL